MGWHAENVQVLHVHSHSQGPGDPKGKPQAWGNQERRGDMMKTPCILFPSQRWLVPLPKIHIVKSVKVKAGGGDDRKKREGEREIKQKISPRMSNAVTCKLLVVTSGPLFPRKMK